MTHYLSAQQVLFIHGRLIAETGGSMGIRDIGLLESAVARPRATFDQVDLYPELFTKAAALFQSLLLNHAFIDGNKRVAITAASLFLLNNGYRLTTTNDELVEFVMEAVNQRLGLERISQWLEVNAAPVPPLSAHPSA